jgi:hypothetical protein
VKRLVVCGIWLKGKHCAFTVGSPDTMAWNDTASLRVGRMRSLQVTAAAQRDTFHTLILSPDSMNAVP